MITKNPYIFERMAMKALRLKWPDAKITDENFNHNFSIEFPNGEYGTVGTANGDLGCDMYESQEDMNETGQPYDSISVCSIWDRGPWHYDPNNWKREEEDPDVLYNESVSMFIVDSVFKDKYELTVTVGRSEYHVAIADNIEELKEAATNYIWMLEAATDVNNLIDAPDILLFPQTNEYQLPNPDGGWNEKRPFKELLDILYGV